MPERLSGAARSQVGSDTGADVLEAVIVDAKYEGYLAKQERLIAQQRSLDSKKIPADLDYATIEHLRMEAKEKLTAFKPATLGHASRISGITPADITVLQIYLRRYFGEKCRRERETDA